MIEIVKRPVKVCTCELCRHEWESLAHKDPLSCPGCRSRKWNGWKKPGRPLVLRDTSTKGLPNPKKVRQL